MANRRLPPQSSARLVWETKPAGEPRAGEFIFRAQEMVIPQAGHDDMPQQEIAAGNPDLNRLIYGDNLQAMLALLAEGYEGKINLIYIDPPFFSQANYSYRVPISGASAGLEVPVIERPAYQDTWAGGIDAYLDMLYPRLQLMKKLLAPDGSIYVHLDASISHYIKVIMDEIFGPGSFQREIIWRIGWISGYKSAVRNWVRNHDTLLFYVKNPGKFTFNKEYIPYPPGYRRRGGQETTGKGYPIEDVWNANPFEFQLKGEGSLDSIQIKSFSREKTGYATQKNKSLLRRIIKASSNPGDLVADFFCGSGTTLVVAEELGRRWLGCELGQVGIQVTRKRLVAEEASPFLIETIRPARADSNLLSPVFPAVSAGVTASDRRPHLSLSKPAVTRLANGQVQITVGLEGYALPGGSDNHAYFKKGQWEALMAKARENFAFLIDYWAVDWNYDGQVFKSQWQAWRDYGKNEQNIPVRATAILEPELSRTIAVQVIDVLGNEVIAIATVTQT
ncbi:site-specific DNA-methyltransferase [Neomoorella mulderi]|uniref:DNA adenine methyltransferase YhdJ n=1 Tax=Moorella mulderi DSM 14980 TaxID=1122241 RepID=A0A151AZW0_9FIRM|nr:site-specific DNA-methyltransferase [Moorella mulderi]KYH33199.1 DNA adenine methyltransferase YhdJ [Moorella mulderi DSM 14980]